MPFEMRKNLLTVFVMGARQTTLKLWKGRGGRMLKSQLPRRVLFLYILMPRHFWKLLEFMLEKSDFFSRWIAGRGNGAHIWRRQGGDAVAPQQTDLDKSLTNFISPGKERQQKTFLSHFFSFVWNLAIMQVGVI